MAEFSFEQIYVENAALKRRVAELERKVAALQALQRATDDVGSFFGKRSKGGTLHLNYPPNDRG